MVEGLKKVIQGSIGWRKIGFGAFASLLIWSFMMWGRPTGFMAVGDAGVILDPAVAKHALTMIFCTAIITIGGNVIERLAPGINARLGAKDT